jgi:hypothetical protein
MLFNAVGMRPGLSRSGNDPRLRSSRRNLRSRHSGNHGIRSHGNHHNHGNRHSRAMRLAHRCRHFPCRRGGRSPSSRRRFLPHPASPPETAKSSISAACRQPARPMLKRCPPTKKSNQRHLGPALRPWPHSSASKPASPVTFSHPPYLWEISTPAIAILRLACTPCKAAHTH